MKLRLFALLAAALMLTGCGEHYEMRRDLSVYFENTDQVVEGIRRGLSEHWESIVVEYSSHGDNMQDIEAIAEELMEFALAETDSPTQGDYLRQQYGGYHLQYGRTASSGSYDYFLTIKPDYYTTPKQEQQVTEAVREIAGNMTGSEYERVRAVYEYLKENVDYDKAAAKSGSNSLKATAYAALIQHKAVCQGYAVAAYRLFRECGLPARVVTGTVTYEDGRQEYHAWDIVGIGGRYYELDITWDDQTGSEDYFLRSAADMPGHRKDDKFLTESFFNTCPPASESYSAGR